jgi:hypothetical protein
MAHPTGRWEISVHQEQFEKIRSNPRLALLVTLARVVNALRFCHLAVVSLGDEDTPSDQRQRVNSFLFTSGILYEGLKVAGVLGKHFGSRDSFKAMAAVLGDTRAKQLREGVLRKLRNKVVFHYDDDVAPQALGQLELNRYVFATGLGSKNGDVYYNLADEVAVNHVVGQPTTVEAERETLHSMIRDITDVTVAFLDASEHLMVDALGDLGFEGHEL